MPPKTFSRQSKTATMEIDNTHLEAAKDIMNMVSRTLEGIDKVIDYTASLSPYDDRVPASKEFELNNFSWQAMADGWSAIPLGSPSKGCGRTPECPLVLESNEFAELTKKLGLFMQLGKAGAEIGMHKHEESSQRMFLLSGRVRVLGVPVELSLSNPYCYIPAGVEHGLVAIEDSMLFVVYVPPVKRPQ